MKIYELNQYSVWTGRERDIDPKDPWPRNWTNHAPPFLAEGEYAQMRGQGNWVVMIEPLNEYDRAREKTRLKQIVAAKRYEREIAGVHVSGMRISTDDRSKSLLGGKVTRALTAQQAGDAGWSFQWKAGGTWVTLDAAQIIGVGVMVDAYIQACFDREGELAAAIDAGTFEDWMLDENWPDTGDG